MASRELAAIRQQLFELDEKVKAEVKRLLRDPELRKILSYPNATVNGDHYVLPVSVNHRHKVPGVVHRVSGTGETVFVEPASIARLSAERITLKSDEEREIKRILRRLSTEVGRVARPLNYALDVIAKLDLITAKARYSRDFNMSKPEMNGDNRLWLREARHPILEQIIRNDSSETRTIVSIEVRLGVGFNSAHHHRAEHGGQNRRSQNDGIDLFDGSIGVAYSVWCRKYGADSRSHFRGHRR